jgi:phosphoserine phosphatase RsbU/P
LLDNALDNGAAAENDDSLNRRIRIANFVSLTALIVIGLYTPVYVWFSEIPGTVMNSVFWLVSAIVYFLISRRFYQTAFVLQTSAGFLYFISGTLVYGLQTNLHFYLLAMCMIVTAIFDDRRIIRFYLLFALAAFTALLLAGAYFSPLVKVGEVMKEVERFTGIVNLLLLFGIVSLFILFFKNGMLRSQKKLLEQKALIEEKNRDITDSIRYAGRIQSALLPDDKKAEQIFPRHFLLFLPRDIVSGDFFWVHEDESYRFAVVGDCTGHGVPGALMSVLGISLLTDIVENRGIADPGEILGELRKGIIYAFDREGTGSEQKDGMDIAVLRFRKNDPCYSWAAANNCIYHFRESGLEELRPDKQPVGYSPVQKPFTTGTGVCAPGDTFVLFTDGFADQFGGPRNKKLMYRPFKKLLKEHLESDTEKMLRKAFAEWKGANDQVDDVCILGIRI